MHLYCNSHAPGRTSVITFTSLNFSAHEAHLDPLTGLGLLVLPHADTDVDDPFDDSGYSLHWSDFEAVGRALASDGWSPVPAADDDEFSLGAWLTVGVRPDGREVVALACGSPVVDEPAVEELLAVDVELRLRAGLLAA